MMTLTRKETEENLEDGHVYTDVYFEEFLREDFVRRGLVLSLDSSGRLARMWFSSSALGTTAWSPDRGLYDAHSWESEDEAMDGSFLQKSFPVILHQASHTEHAGYGLRIVQDVMSGCANVYVNEIVRQALESGDGPSVHGERLQT